MPSPHYFLEPWSTAALDRATKRLGYRPRERRAIREHAKHAHRR